MFVNNMWSGSKHDSTKVPLLTVGGLDRKLATGRVLDYSKRPEEERKLCALYLALMQRMGVEATAFGDAAQPLVDL